MTETLTDDAGKMETLERLLEEEREKSAYYRQMAEEKGRQYLHEVSELSAALIRYRQTEKELRESEERYRVAIEDSHDGVAILRGETHIYVNRRLVDIFGYESPEDLVDKSLTLIVHRDDRERVAELVAMQQKDRLAPSRYEFKGVKRDGTPVYVEAAVTATTYKGGDATLVYLRDIGDRKRLEEEILKASKLESLGTLAGGIAHDFNNIMTAIMGNISLAKLSTKPDDPAYKRLVGAEQAVLRAKDLTQQLLTFSKGGTPIKKTTGITHILEDSTKFVLTGSSVRCLFNLPADLWQADVDEGQMSQVIQNLVINAKEAMPEGGVIEVLAENVTLRDERGPALRKGPHIRVSIKDQGMGIPEEHLDKIFDPYFTTKQRGSGLGLATSYSIVRKHGGSIHVKSHLGIGTTFTIYLPAAAKKVPVRARAGSGVVRGKGKILLMDDEEIVRDTIGEMLSFLGYETGFARDGIEAIDLYVEARKKGEPFDIIILDLTVPGGMGGQEAMEEFLAIDPKVKAIVSSGYANNRIMSDFGRYGFVDVITKPYKLEELGETVSRALAKPL